MQTYLRWAASGVLVLALAFCCGCRPSSIEAVRLNQRGQIYFEHGRYEQAKELLLASIKADPENPASHYWLGRCYELEGDLTKAIWEYGLAVRFVPAMDVAHMALVTAYQRDGQAEESLRAARSWLAQTSVPARQIVWMAEVLDAQDMPEHAVAAYEAAQQAEPHNARPSVALAEYHLNKGDEKKGVAALIAASKIDPLYPGLAKQLGGYGYKIEIPEPRIFQGPTDLEKEIYELD